LAKSFAVSIGVSCQEQIVEHQFGRASIAPVRCLMPRVLANSGIHQAAAASSPFSRVYQSAAATLCGSFRNNGTSTLVST